MCGLTTNLRIITSPKWMHQLKVISVFYTKWIQIFFCHNATENQTSLLSNRQHHLWKMKKMQWIMHTA